MEGPLADGLRAQREQKSFNFPSYLAGDLKTVGFDIVSTANNHSMDREEAGVFKTIEAYEKHALLQVGMRRNPESSVGYYKVLKVQSVLVGWIACTDLVNSYHSKLVAHCAKDRDLIAELIRHLKLEAKVDIVVLAPHWGDEYRSSPSARQVSLADYFFTKGADLIFGAHPHVLQKAEMKVLKDELGETKNRLVFYSLGNFISNQLWLGVPQGTGAIARVKIEKLVGTHQVMSYDVVPVATRANPIRLEVLRDKSSPNYKEVVSKGLKIANSY